MRSNFSKNEHHLGNGEIVGCGARVAAARCERRKGKIQVPLINAFLNKEIEFGFTFQNIQTVFESFKIQPAYC